MAELVDALDSGSSGREFVEVRVLSRAPDTKNQKSIRALKLLGVLFLFLSKLLEKKTAGLGRRFKFFLD